jgi:DegV family protein with EDD domain
MSNVSIVTDSTASIPEELIKEYDISLVPQVLIWGEETFEDGVDIQPKEFYDRLAVAEEMPTTSQVTPKSFQKIFDELLAKDKEILAILISQPLSGTIASALQVQETMPEKKIEIFDSQSVSLALGFQVLAAAKAAKEGASVEECRQMAEKARDRTGVVFAVDTLEFLHRGGRIGGAKRLMGTALRIKPILEIVDGKIDAVESVRTRKKSLNRVIEIIHERTKGKSPLRLGALHANSPDVAQMLLDVACTKLNPDEKIFTEISPVLGTHAGPGTVGLAYMVEM